MISLTTPAQINSVLGGNAPVNYDKLVLSPFTLDAIANTVSGTLKLTSTGNPDMQPITGGLKVVVGAGELVIEVPQLDFYRRVTLSAGQQQSVQTIVRNAQNALEAGLIGLGVIAGGQSTGT